MEGERRNDLLSSKCLNKVANRTMPTAWGRDSRKAVEGHQRRSWLQSQVRHEPTTLIWYSYYVTWQLHS
jgi:hypothetical protein